MQSRPFDWLRANGARHVAGVWISALVAYGRVRNIRSGSGGNVDVGRAWYQ